MLHWTLPSLSFVSIQVLMSPATAARTRRGGSEGGCCRTRTTTAARRQIYKKEQRTALLQVRQDERKRTPLPLSPLSSSPEQREGDQTILTTPCPFCPPPHFDFLMWGNPNCEVRWFPTSARSSRRWHSGCLSGFHTQPSSHFFRILQISFSLPAPSFPSLSHTDSLSFFPFFFPSHFFFLADFKRQKKKPLFPRQPFCPVIVEHVRMLRLWSFKSLLQG